MIIVMEQLFFNHFWIVTLLAVWSLPWKGVALWRAAHNHDKRWFTILLFVNTLAVLDILYLYVWGKKKGI